MVYFSFDFIKFVYDCINKTNINGGTFKKLLQPRIDG